ncbi:MAG: hypothetical protein KF816_14925 [Melioribacteraceae bacterium]|jgi:predicted Fe-Mo cluster-binding NifX family protein|nr:hypothetical protein [Melioribacteraceae bacterium]
MKLAIATDDFSTVTGHIGRCNGFLIYEIEDNQIISREERENVFTNHKLDGDHHHGTHNHSHGHSNLVTGLNDCSHLICSSAGWRVVEDLKKNGIEVIFTSENDAETAALTYCNGELDVSLDGTCHSH